MAFGAGKAGVFKIDDTGGGTLTDVSAYCTSVQLQTPQGAYDTTTLGSSWKSAINGLGEWTIQVDGIYDATADGYFGVLDSASRSIELYPAGTPVGATKPKFSGEVLKTSYQVNDPVDGVVSFTLSLQGTGTLTRATS